MIYNQSALTVPTYIVSGEPVDNTVVNRLVQNTGGLVTRVTELSNNQTITSGNSNVTITANRDVLILCNNTVDINVTLATASSQYKQITIKKIGNNAAKVNILRSGSDTIENPLNPLSTPTATTIILYAAEETITLISFGNTYRIVDYYMGLSQKVKLFKTTAQNITGSVSTYTKLQLDSEEEDPSNLWDTTNYRFTCNRPGEYVLSGYIGIFAVGSRTDVLRVVKTTGASATGYQFAESDAVTGNQNYALSLNLNLLSGDILEFEVRTTINTSIRQTRETTYVQIGLVKP
jgi:hypothetical protein